MALDLVEDAHHVVAPPLPVIVHRQQREEAVLLGIVLVSLLQNRFRLIRFALKQEHAVQLGIGVLVGLVLIDHAPVKLLGGGEISLRRQRSRQLHHHALLSRLDAVSPPVFIGRGFQEFLPLFGTLILVSVGGAAVIQIADQPVRIVRVRVALEQVLRELIDLVHPLLLALGHGEVDFRQLDHRVPVVRRIRR